MKIGIVGNGLFGSIIGDTLLRQGHEVHRYDIVRPNNGSQPAACLMKPGWLSKVPRLNEVFDLLDELYGLQELTFTANGMLDFQVKWVNPRRILHPLLCATEISHVNTDGVIEDKRGVEIKFDRVIVAAGVWTKELCPWVPVEARWGMALLWRNHQESVLPSTISQWAPYKQLIGFQRGDGFWGGDGSALKRWEHEAEQRVYDRIYDHFDLGPHPVKLIGQRPYVAQTTPGHPCWLEQRDKLIIATGGAKNGTAAAGFCALTIREWLRG
jgi:glycine/D-amino acid oxidase-like deaminating enzyme